MNAELAGSIYWNSERHRRSVSLQGRVRRGAWRRALAHLRCELVLARLAAVALDALQAGEGGGAILGDGGAGVVPCLGFDRVEEGLAEGGGVGQLLLAAPRACSRTVPWAHRRRWWAQVFEGDVP
jgi:hypothetical protein